MSGGGCGRGALLGFEGSAALPASCRVITGGGGSGGVWVGGGVLVVGSAGRIPGLFLRCGGGVVWCGVGWVLLVGGVLRTV